MATNILENVDILATICAIERVKEKIEKVRWERIYEVMLENMDHFYNAENAVRAIYFDDDNKNLSNSSYVELLLNSFEVVKEVSRLNGATARDYLKAVEMILFGITKMQSYAVNYRSPSF